MSRLAILFGSQGEPNMQFIRLNIYEGLGHSTSWPAPLGVIGNITFSKH